MCKSWKSLLILYTNIEDTKIYSVIVENNWEYELFEGALYTAKRIIDNSQKTLN
jgi:hypothetical protein